MRKQIIISFTLIFLLFGLGSIVIVRNLVHSTENLRNLIDLHEIEDIRQNLYFKVQKVQAYAFLPAENLPENRHLIDTNIAALKETVQGCFDCHHTQEIHNDLLYTEKLILVFHKNFQNLMSPSTQINPSEDLQQQTIDIADEISNIVQEMINRASATLRTKTDQAMKGINKTYIFLIITLLVPLGLAIYIAKDIINKITRPVEELSLATQKIANGELDYKTRVSGFDEFAELIDRFNEMSLALAAKDKENAALCNNLEQKVIELETAQDKLLTAEKLASLGKLAGGISHDFNNILCGIIGHISLLKSTKEETAEDYPVIETIDKAAKRASKLVNQLQTFANPKDWQEIPININDILKPITLSLQQEIGREIPVTFHLEKNIAAIHGDPDHINELVRNICSNAMQALPPNEGVLKISTCNKTVTSFQENHQVPPGKYVTITITDNGTGISDKVLRKVFDPYFSTKEFGARKGIGLGMAIAFSIVRKHNGHIHIDSTEGVGTSVIIYLPTST